MSPYEEIRTIERELRELAERITHYPGQQIMMLASRAADGAAVNSRTILTIKGSPDPYVHITFNDGSEQLTWKGGSLRPEQFRTEGLPAGCDDSIWIRMQEEHRKKSSR